MNYQRIIQIIAVSGLIVSLFSLICAADSCSTDPSLYRATVGGITYNGYGQVISTPSGGDYVEFMTPVSTPTPSSVTKNLTNQSISSRLYTNSSLNGTVTNQTNE